MAQNAQRLGPVVARRRRARPRAARHVALARLVDGGGPAVTGIALPQNPGTGGWYAPGDLVRIDVEFDGAIGPETRSDTPNKATVTPNLRMIVGDTERMVTDCFRLWRNGAYNALRCRYVGAGRRPRHRRLELPGQRALVLPSGRRAARQG